MQLEKETKTPSSFKYKSFDAFLSDFKSSMNRAFYEIGQIDQFSSSRGFPPEVLAELMATNPLGLCIPTQYGGFGATIKENITFISAAAYESLPFSLMLGINNGLFIQPFSKYGQESEKISVFRNFISQGSMGGLMITEPNFGSDALNMQTSYTVNENQFHLKGKKHWAGLTGMADYWLLTARRKTESGNLMRDVDFFVCDTRAPHQQIIVEEYFQNLGLYQIPYGRNSVDVKIPIQQRLIPETSGVQMMLDLLHRSRFQFPAMGLGFIKRMLDEAILHTRHRMVGNKNLLSYDQVQHRISILQAYYTISSAFCLNSSEVAKVENNLASLGMEANSVKCLTTDMMQHSAQSLLQLVGAKGYQLNHIAGKSVVDSRPFQIFEGSNDILYHQIAESLIKQMKNLKEKNLAHFFRNYAPRTVDSLFQMLDFEINSSLSQRKLVNLGKIVSRIIATDKVVFLGENGFREDLIINAIAVLKREISVLINAYHIATSISIIENYEEEGSWVDVMN